MKVVLLLFALFLVGCQSDQRPQSPQNPQTQTYEQVLERVDSLPTGECLSFELRNNELILVLTTRGFVGASLVELEPEFYIFSGEPISLGDLANYKGILNWIDIGIRNGYLVHFPTGTILNNCIPQ
jgi:hypothetical protein